MAAPINVTDTTFRETVLSARTPVLVFFWAYWNATCKTFAPTVAELAEEYEGRVLVGRLDVDANPVTPGLFGIVPVSVPVTLIFAGGQAQRRLEGYQPGPIIRAALDEIVAAHPAAG